MTRSKDGVDDSAIGGNASAEGAAEGEGADDSGTVSGINVVLDNRLQETGFAKKGDYQKVMKASYLSCQRLFELKRSQIYSFRRFLISVKICWQMLP